MGLQTRWAERSGVRGRRALAVIAVLVLGAAVALPTAAWAQSADPFVIGGVAVTVEAGDSVSAREQAFTLAQRDALGRLFDRLGVADRIAPGDLSRAEATGVMQSLRVEEESTVPGAYTGVFEVTFRPDAVRAVLAGRGLEPTIPDPADLPPADDGTADTAATGDEPTEPTGPGAAADGTWLIVPVWRDAQGTRLWDGPNPWFEAWRGLDPSLSPVTVVTPLADLEDLRLLDTGQAVAAAPDALAALSERHGASRAVVALASAGVGGMVIELRQPGGDALTTDPLGITGTTTDPAVLGRAVAAVLSAISGQPVAAPEAPEDEQETAAGVLAPLSATTPGSRLSLTVRLDQPRDWLRVRAALAGLEPVTGARVDSLSGTAVRLELGFVGSEADLAAALRSRGLDLQVAPQGRELRLVR